MDFPLETPGTTSSVWASVWTALVAASPLVNAVIAFFLFRLHRKVNTPQFSAWLERVGDDQRYELCLVLRGPFDVAQVRVASPVFREAIDIGALTTGGGPNYFDVSVLNLDRVKDDAQGRLYPSMTVVYTAPQGRKKTVRLNRVRRFRG